jgi:hypothetical protein
LSLFAQRFESDRNDDDITFTDIVHRFQVDTSDLISATVWRDDTAFVWKTMGKDADGGQSQIRMFYSADTFQSFSSIQYTFDDTMSCALTCIFEYGDSLYFIYQKRRVGGTLTSYTHVAERAILSTGDFLQLSSFTEPDTLLQADCDGFLSNNKKIDNYVFQANKKFYLMVGTSNGAYGGECIIIYESNTFPNNKNWTNIQGYNFPLIWNAAANIYYEGCKYLGKIGGYYYMTTVKSMPTVNGQFTQILKSNDIVNWTEVNVNWTYDFITNFKHNIHLQPILFLTDTPFESDAYYHTFTLTDSAAINKGLNTILIKTYDFTWFYAVPSAIDSLLNEWE